MIAGQFGQFFLTMPREGYRDMILEDYGFGEGREKLPELP